MKRLFGLLITFFFALGNLHAQTPGEHMDVTHYEINLWGFDFTNKTLQGEAFVTFSALERIDTFVLELKTLIVTDVACDRYEVSSFEQSEDLLVITFDEPMQAGETVTLDIRYGGNTFNESWGGVEWWGTDYVYNLGVGFESIPHNLGKTWFPCVDNFTDKATYSLAITVDNDKKAVCGGYHTTTVDNGDGTSTWYWEIPQEIATYHISFAVGDYDLWEDVYHGIERDIPIEVWVKPAQMNNVPGTFSHIHEIAAFYEEHFGPYPFNRIGYVCTGKGCMEHVDNIAITPGVITGDNTQEQYIAHELSHMYFGNKVTCATAGDMWLNEGFAQFCGMFYLVGVYGESSFQGEMDNTINTITSWCKNPNNWIPLNDIPESMTYDSKAVYNRGAVILSTMMQYMGRAPFLAGIRQYLSQYSFADATSEQLRDALTQATGIDMNGFFDTYVFTAGMPHFEANIVEVHPNGSQYEAKVRCTYEHLGPSHVGQDNRVEVTFVGADGSLQDETLCWDGLESEQTLTFDFEPIAAYVDYHNRILDAKYDKNLTATGPASTSQSRLQVDVTSVTDSVRIRIESHLVGPKDDPEYPGIVLSTSHYWNVLRQDFGEAHVSGQFTYTNAQDADGDIIHTANDSAILLYRPNVMESWYSIPYSFEGNWRMGRFTVDELPSGQYTIAVFEKNQISTSEITATTTKLFPNPASSQVTMQWDAPNDGLIRIYNANLQLVKVIPYQQTDHLLFSVEDLAKGLYLVERQNEFKPLIVK